MFFEPMRWRIDEKIHWALFVCCISQFCRSQGMVFAPVETWKRMHVVHCGIDPAFFRPVSHAGLGRRLLCVGRQRLRAVRFGIEAPALLRQQPSLGYGVCQRMRGLSG